MVDQEAENHRATDNPHEPHTNTSITEKSKLTGGTEEKMKNQKPMITTKPCWKTPVFPSYPLLHT